MSRRIDKLQETKMTLDRVTFLAVLLACAVGAAAAADAGRSGASPAAALSPRGVAAAPLKGELRLNPGDLRLVAIQTNIDALAKDFTRLSGSAKAYESMAKSIPDMVQQCSSKAYSVQDQTAAGCTANDTVAQCSDKLLKYCLANYKGTRISTGMGLPGGSVAGVPMNAPGSTNRGTAKIGFSIKEFQQTAGSAAAEARALSQLLSVYANQIEQNAKKLLP